MESKLLAVVGKLAGIGGISLGVLLLLFKDILADRFLVSAGLGPAQAFAIIFALMIFTFSITGIGVISWLIGNTVGDNRPVPGPALGLLAALVVVALAASVYVGRPQGSTITVTYKVCVGDNPLQCPPDSVHLQCGSTVAEWANKECASFNSNIVSSRAGGQCGYSVANVVCTKNN